MTTLAHVYTTAICAGCGQHMTCGSPCAYPLTRWGYLTVHRLCKVSPQWGQEAA